MLRVCWFWCFALGVVRGAVSADDGAAVEFSPLVANAGTVLYGNKADVAISVTNTGTTDLHIFAIEVTERAAYGAVALRTQDERTIALVPQVRGEKPALSLGIGQTCEIVVTIRPPLGDWHPECVVDGAGLEDKKRKPVQFGFRVHTNAKEAREQNVVVNFKTAPSLRFARRDDSFGMSFMGDEVTREVDIEVVDGAAFAIKAASVAEPFEVKLEALGEQPTRRYRAKLRKRPDVAPTRLSLFVTLETTMAERPRLDVDLGSVTVQGPIEVKTQHALGIARMDFGVLRKGQTNAQTAHIINHYPKIPWIPREWSINSSYAKDMDVTVKELVSGAKYDVLVTVKETMSARAFRGTADIEVDHPYNPGGAVLQIGFSGWCK